MKTSMGCAACDYPAPGDTDEDHMHDGLEERVRIGDPALEPTKQDFSPQFRITHEMLANVPDTDFIRIMIRECDRRKMKFVFYDDGRVNCLYTEKKS